MMKTGNIKTIASKKKGENKAIIHCENNLCIDSCETAKAEFIQAIEKFDHLSIELSNVNSMDIPFVQLLIALKKTAVKKKITIDYNVQLNDELNKLLLNSGIDINKILN